MREMKDSGIPWIGAVPEGTVIERLKFMSYMKGRIGWQGLKSEDFIEEGPYCVTGTDFVNGEIDWSNCYHVSNERYEMDSNIHLKVGDLLVTKDGTIGKLAKITELPDKACLNSHLLIIRPITGQFTNEYLYYVMSSPLFSGYYQFNASGSIMDSISQKGIGEFAFPVYPISEQKAIVTYLDDKCAEIDSSISRHKAIIEKLQEYRKAVITQAVTKGLDPDVEMKDSEIPWIGAVRSDSSLYRLKHALKEPLKYGANESGIGYNPQLPRYIRITDIDESGALKSENMQSLSEEQANGYVLTDGTVLFARSGATVGKTFLYKEEYGRAAFAGYLIAAVPNDNIMLPEWLMYYTQSSLYENWKNNIFTQATIQNIGADKYSNLLVPVVSIQEQEKIICQLNERCSQIDEAISRQGQAIEKLEEYRKSVIYNAVTGKIDCRKDA